MLSAKMFFKTDPVQARHKGNPKLNPDSIQYFFQMRIEFTLRMVLPVRVKL